jgi:trans-2-enoyl-CoA reductase
MRYYWRILKTYSRKNSFTRLVQFCCFEKKHKKAGLYAKVSTDAFSDEIKKR